MRPLPLLSAVFCLLLAVTPVAAGAAPGVALLAVVGAGAEEEVAPALNGFLDAAGGDGIGKDAEEKDDDAGKKADGDDDDDDDDDDGDGEEEKEEEDEKPDVVKIKSGGYDLGVTVRYEGLMHGYFLPSLAHLLGSKIGDAELNLMTVALVNDAKEPLTVTVKAMLQGYSEWAKETVTVPAGGSAAVNLCPTFKQELSVVVEQCPGSIEWAVETADGKVLAAKTRKISIAGRNDVLLGEGFNPFLATMITPNDPAIDGLLGCARDLKLINEFNGYQSGDKDVVLAQVKAIYDLAARLGIHYRDATNNWMGNKGIDSQKVFFPRETLARTGANCLDGTVLLASMVERVGLHPYIVLVPGHAFLAVGLAEDDAAGMVFIETTMLGDNDAQGGDDDGDDDDDDQETEMSSNFAEAVQAAEATYKENAKKDSASLVNVAACRAAGILPYPYYRQLLEKPVNIRQRLGLE